MKTVLVTGSAGFIGMHTSIKFLKEGYRVIGVDNLNSYTSLKMKKKRLYEIQDFNKKNKSEWYFIKSDLNDENLWNKLRKYKISKVIHLAAQAGVRYSIMNPELYLKSNISAFQKLINFVIENEIKTFIYASSSSVYGKNSKSPFTENEKCVEPESYYAATKRFNELMTLSYYKTHNLNSIGLRFFTVYGPWGRPDMAAYMFIDSCFNNNNIKLFNHGKQTRDFTYIDDIVQGIYLISINTKINQGNHIFNIGRGKPEKLIDFVSEIEIACGKKLNIDYKPHQKGDVVNTHCSVNKLKSTIKYWEFTTLSVGINNMVKWYISYHKSK